MPWMRRPDKAKRAGPDPEVFVALRSQVLNLDPSSIGVAPSAELPRAFGVVMDMSYREGSATVVAIADRTTSLYTSAGGGVIGGGDHASVARANRRLLLVAEAHLEHFARRDVASLPAVGQVRITALTYSGLNSLEAPADDLGYGRHPAAPVFHAVQDVITALREVEEGTSSASTAAEQLPGGATPLMAAALGGDSEAVTRLIEQGVPIEGHDDSGYTALMYAANAGQDEVVRVLLAHGADPNAADGQMSSPLMFAAQHDHVDIVRQLLAMGADPNARGSHGLTALGFARQNGHSRTVAVLTSAGAPE